MYTVVTPMFDHNGRKYMVIKEATDTIGTTSQEGLKIKIPFRYNRVMCKVSGDKTVQELVTGDKVTAKIKNCGRWEINGYTDICYKCEEISFIGPIGPEGSYS
jgi:hypothetical protein